MGLQKRYRSSERVIFVPSNWVLLRRVSAPDYSLSGRWVNPGIRNTPSAGQIICLPLANPPDKHANRHAYRRKH